jgi:hypothetical protein
MDYIKDHHLVELIEVLSASLFYYRPDDPKKFLVDQLQLIQKLKGQGDVVSNEGALFTSEDIGTLFSMFAKRMETITPEQAKTGFFEFSLYSFLALESIGIYTDDIIDKPLDKNAFIELVFAFFLCCMLYLGMKK